MPNESHNDQEQPGYLDFGSKLFSEAPPGQSLDFTETNRDVDLLKHVFREGQARGMKPVRMWLFSHEDARSGNTGPSSGSASDDPGHDDFYGDGGTGPGQNAQDRGGPSDDNFYNEMRDKVYVGPITISCDYQPNTSEHVLLDLGVEKNVKDVFVFLIDDAIRHLGRVPNVGDLIERFDGKIMEIVTSVETDPVNFVWLFQTCTAVNTNKPVSQIFRT